MVKIDQKLYCFSAVLVITNGIKMFLCSPIFFDRSDRNSNPSAKRTCIELSPCGEESSNEEKLNLAKKVEGAISNSVNTLISKLLDDI